MKPYVSVTFEGKTARTSVAFGSNPSWNEQIELDWTHGLSRIVGGIQTMEKEEYLYINVFDEKVQIEANETGDEQTTHSYKHWIGGRALPLSAILLGGKVEVKRGSNSQFFEQKFFF